MRAYRIRVYGEPRRHLDPHQLAHAVLMLARELHEQQRADEQSRAATPSQITESGSDDAS